MGKDEERRMMYLLLQLAPGGLAVVVARDEHPGQARQQVPSAASAASAVPVQGVAQEGLEVRHGALPAPALGGEAREAALEEGVARPELALVAVCGARVHVARPAREGAAGVQALCVSETGQTRCRQSSPSPLYTHTYINASIDSGAPPATPPRPPGAATRRGGGTAACAGPKAGGGRGRGAATPQIPLEPISRPRRGSPGVREWVDKRTCRVIPNPSRLVWYRHAPWRRTGRRCPPSTARWCRRGAGTPRRGWAPAPKGCGGGGGRSAPWPRPCAPRAPTPPARPARLRSRRA